MILKYLKYKDSATNCISLDKECVSKLVMFLIQIYENEEYYLCITKSYFTGSFLQNLQNVYEK